MPCLCDKSRPAPLTVAVVAYNHEKWIAECMDSIAKQTWQPSQVVVIDDASPDRTSDVVVETARSNPHIQWNLVLNEINCGLTRNLNRALALADQPYFTYISGDDRMLPHRIEVQLCALHDSSPDITWSYSDAVREDEIRTPFQDTFLQAYPRCTEPEAIDDFQAILRSNFVPAPSILARTQAIREVGGYDEELFFEDLDLLLRLSKTGRSVAIPEPLVAFRELPSSLGHQQFFAENPIFMRNLSAILRKHLDNSGPADSHIRDRIWHLALRRWRAGENDASVRQDLRRTWRFSPSPLSGAARTIASHIPLLESLVYPPRRLRPRKQDA